MMTDQQHTAPTTEGVLSSRFRALTLGVLTLVAAAAFSLLGVSTALPAAADELGGLALYGWVYTAFTLANVVGLAIAGPVTIGAPWDAHSSAAWA